MADKIPEGFEPIGVQPGPQADAIPEGFVPVESAGMDALKSLGAGLATGVAGIPGAVGDVQQLTRAGIESAAAKIEAENPKLAARMRKRFGDVFQLPTTEDVKKATALNKLDYEPQTDVGRYLKTTGTFLPGALTGGTGVAGRFGNVVKFGLAPGIGSEAAGDIAQKIGLTPGEAQVAKVAAGFAAPSVASRLMSPLRFVGPPASEAAHAAHVARVEQAGIPVSAGERADSRGLRFIEDELNHNNYKAKLEAVTRAATREVGNGRGGTYETPVIEHGSGGTVDTMLGETGQRFNDLAARNTLHGDAQLGLDLANLRNRFTAVPGAYQPETVAALHGYAQHVTDLLTGNGPHSVTGNHFLTGEQYQRLRSHMNDAAMSAEGERSTALHALREAFDNAMERSIARSNPIDAGLFPEARRDYRNALVIAHAARAKNVAGAEGYITPASIEAAASNVYGARAHQRGYDPFDWAPSAKAVLKVEPNSGTASRGMFHAANMMIGQGAGAAAGIALGGHDPIPLQLVLEHLGFLPGLALPAVERPVIRAISPYLGNQVARHTSATYGSLPGLLTAAEAARQLGANQ